MTIAQDVAALLLVSLAVLFLVHRVWRLFFRRASGCGACGTCPVSAGGEPGIMTIAPLPHITASSPSAVAGETN